MKITKERDGQRFSVYQPDREEARKLLRIADEVWDLISSYNLTDDETIHLISSLFEVVKTEYNIEGIFHKPKEEDKD